MAFSCGSLKYLGQRQLATNFLRGIYAPQIRVVSIKASPVKSGGVETHDERNARLKRPQSPHLTIYKPQLTTMLSITHRGTGLALGSLLMGWGIGGLVLPKSFPEYLSVIQSWNLPLSVIFTAKLIIAFPLCYHYCNGIRHLLWDSGRFLNISDVYKTGYAMIAASVLLTGIIASL